MRLVSPSTNAADSSQSDQKPAMKSSYSGGSLSSSLDFKADANLKHLTTPGGRPKEKKRFQEQVEQHVRQPPYATRARGSSGIPPPRKFDPSNLEQLSEEELMQVLYRDPELAKAAAARAQSSKQQRTSSTGGRGRTSRKRPKSRSPAEYPAHIQDRMEEGIPIFQWFFVLALLGIGIYQLRKLLTLPPPSSRDNKTHRKPARGGKQPKAVKTAKSKGKAAKANSIKNNKGTSNADHRKSKSNNSKTQSLPKGDTQEKDYVKDFQHDKGPSSKTSKKRNKNQKASPNNGDRPLVDKGNHRSSATPLEASSMLTKQGETTKTEDAVTEDDDDTGWQPVGKKTPRSDRSNHKAAIDTEVKDASSQEESKGKPSASPPRTEPTAAMPHQQGKGEDKKKNKKSKLESIGNRNSGAEHAAIKGKVASVGSQAEALGSDSDAALALQLQQEERNPSQTNTSPVEQEQEWAEVPKKSRRKASSSRLSG